MRNKKRQERTIELKGEHKRALKRKKLLIRRLKQAREKLSRIKLEKRSQKSNSHY